MRLNVPDRNFVKADVSAFVRSSVVFLRMLLPFLLQQVERQDDLSQRALEDIVPPADPVQNQPFAKQRVKKDEDRSEDHSAPDSILKSKFLVWGAEQFLGFQPGITLLRPDPAGERFPIVVLDNATEFTQFPADL